MNLKVLLVLLASFSHGHRPREWPPTTRRRLTSIQSQEITIEGVLTEIAWRNPHSRFRVDVVGEGGSTAEWLAEMGGVNIMRRAGFPMEVFGVGDRITITGNPGRRGRTMRLREVVLHDGTRLNEDL